MGSDRVLKECISRDSEDPVIDKYALWLFPRLFGTPFLCFLPFMASYDAFELLYPRPFGQNHFFLSPFFCFLPFMACYDAFELLYPRPFGQNHFFSLTGVFDIVISKLPFIQTVCLNTSYFFQSICSCNIDTWNH